MNAFSAAIYRYYLAKIKSENPYLNWIQHEDLAEFACEEAARKFIAWLESSEQGQSSASVEPKSE